MREKLRVTSLAGLAVLVVVVLAEHLISPGLDPSQHTISEYVNARSGWLMKIGFAAWSLSLGALAVLVVSDAQGVERRWAWGVLAGLLALACAGLVVTAIFPTQTSAGVLPSGVARSTEGRLHDLGSGAALLALFGAVIASTAAVELAHIGCR